MYPALLLRLLLLGEYEGGGVEKTKKIRQFDVAVTASIAIRPFNVAQSTHTDC
jgi:hypothetical protein